MMSVPGHVLCRFAGAWVRPLSLGWENIFAGGIRVGCYGYLCLKAGDVFARVSGTEKW